MDWDRKHPLDWAIALLFLLTLIATSLAARFTYGQWATADDQEKRSLRAYAFPSPKGIENFGKDQIPIGGIVTRTMGQTPAYKLRGKINTRGMPYPLRDDVDLDADIFNNQIQNSAFLGPLNTFALNAPWVALDQTTVDAINDGQKYRLYVWGSVDYEDVFKEPHWFTFCYAYSGSDILKRETAETCHRHNDDDHH